MIHRFTVSATGSITQPSSAQKLIVRSSSASDTTNNLTIYGINDVALATSEYDLITGQREYETTTVFASVSQLMLDAPATGTISVRAQGTKAVGDIRLDALMADNTPLTIGLVGFTDTYTFKTVASGVNPVVIGASTLDAATNLATAINANPSSIFTATAAGNVVTLTDKIACDRLIPYSMTGDEEIFSLRLPTGGVDGALIADLAPETTYVGGATTFFSEDGVAATLFALTEPTSNPAVINGRSVRLHIRIDGTVLPITIKYQVTVDGIHWEDGETVIPALPAAGNGYYAVNLAENAIHKMRIVVTNNMNNVDVALSVVAIYAA